jgi:hypothetical protein
LEHIMTKIPNADFGIARRLEAYVAKGEKLPVAVAHVKKDEPEMWAQYVAERRAAKAGSGPTDDSVERFIFEQMTKGVDPQVAKARANAKKASAATDKLLNMSEGTASQRLAKETADFCHEHGLDAGSLKSQDEARAALRVTRPDIYADLAAERLAGLTKPEPTP